MLAELICESPLLLLGEILREMSMFKKLKGKLAHNSYDDSSFENESMVSLVSRRYMRGENGTHSLVVRLTEYVTLRSVFTLLIAV